jgi:hypothetical protein
MSIQDKVVQNSTKGKLKWWYWLLLVIGLVLVIGGTVYVIVT